MNLIISKLLWRHGFPWLSLPIRPNHPSLPAGLQNYILYPYWANVNEFLLVSQYKHVYV